MATKQFNIDQILLLNDVIFNEKDRVTLLINETKHKGLLWWYQRKLKDLEELRTYIVKNNSKI